VFGRKRVASPEEIDNASKNGPVGLGEVLKNGCWTDIKRRFLGQSYKEMISGEK
jgi:hypothetical protein